MDIPNIDEMDPEERADVMAEFSKILMLVTFNSKAIDRDMVEYASYHQKQAMAILLKDRSRSSLTPAEFEKYFTSIADRADELGVPYERLPYKKIYATMQPRTEIDKDSIVGEMIERNPGSAYSLN